MNAMIIFICLAAVYGALKVFLERHLAPLDAVGEEGDLSDVAFFSGCSVYALFQAAADRWQFPRARIDSDVKTYLNTGDIPGYVRLYVKAQPTITRDRTYSKLIFPGGRPLYP